VCVIYFTVSGGAFGLEPLVGAVGPGFATLLIVVTPVVWSLPMALMVAELATLLPEDGGYYIWVKESLGDFWAVQEAWWTMGYSSALVAMLSLLFVTYLDHFIRAGNVAPVSVPPYVLQGMFSRAFHNDDLLPKIRKPVLITHGCADAVVKHVVVDQHKAALPHAQVHLMPHAGHAAFWDDTPEFNERLHAFCESL
jgi:pimeloyl-ACP methyl ester carboxylesterase